jgi:hypothetical protein
MEGRRRGRKVGRAYIVDNALVEGAICDTMDLRRSVMLGETYGGYKMFKRLLKMHEMLSRSRECGDVWSFNRVVGQPRRQ